MLEKKVKVITFKIRRQDLVTHEIVKESKILPFTT